MNLKPLSDHLIVKPIVEDKTTKSGIVLPDTVDKDKPETGEVVAVGPGRVLDNGNRLAMSVKVGQKVLFKKYSPDEFKVDGEDYLVLSESDVIAIIEK
ncbi:co-chaperone GroES [Candidatus Kuenenbacteria bacterium RIFCSPHIGHO2_02_FULL_39_13]|uniref:Co-chaperonin GroES n=1 Tax=Candidatus Kuenenbacteria bacterium RIFCSPHIGHO2_02_FULL_39_13 TaxID=1798561 RepID=A0A1F6FP74_9BACT|nr:MAG: co-chaperone GroES [Candidatus Kuenenbacteria bacterium RIFCSPHIGHO2_02_FULL_39_13]